MNLFHLLLDPDLLVCIIYLTPDSAERYMVNSHKRKQDSVAKTQIADYS